jgi:methane/ammonia monooxygenase subunit C
MSLISGTTRAGEVAAVSEKLWDSRPVIIGAAAICTYYICVRIYEQAFGQLYGLDSFAPEFTTGG